MYGTERRNIRNIYIPYIRGGGGGGGFPGNVETMLATPLGYMLIKELDRLN